MEPLACYCTEIIYAIYSSSPDLESELLPNAEKTALGNQLPLQLIKGHAGHRSRSS